MKNWLHICRKRLSGVDFLLLCLCLTAGLYGLLLLYSATYSYRTTSYLRTQLTAILLGAAGYLVLSCVDLRRVTARYPWLFGCNLLLLLLPLFFGVEDGNRSWIRIGGVGFQPGELGKLFFCLSFAGHLDQALSDGMHPTDVLLLIAHAATLSACVMLCSRDDGMTLAFLVIVLSMAFAAGLRLRVLAAGAAALMGIFPLLWVFLLNTYQKNRILAVFQPEAYPDTAYQAMQTVHAITAGGVMGRGYLQGDKTQVSLIPTKHTDAILAVAGEELGFVGCAGIFLLLLLILLRCFSAALHSPNRASALALYGAAGMMGFQTVLNAGMNLGLLPVVGLTLPFFSYGGTSMVTMFLTMGMVSSVRRTNRTEDRIDRKRGKIV